MVTQSTPTERSSAMRTPEPAKSRAALQKRVERLLGEGRRGRSARAGQDIFPFLRSLGSAVLIGGAIRDVARAGIRSFSSDLDFVIYGSPRDEFLSKVRDVGVRNKFGGFAISGFGIKLDVWHLEDTWARTAGLRRVETPADLLNCTFFDWDSVIYELDTGKLVLPDDYFDRLSANVMDIRLEPNPNQMGATVRALRRAALWNVGFGPKLTQFCLRALETIPWDDLVALDSRAFPSPVLRRLSRSALLDNLAAPKQSVAGVISVPVPIPQLGLSFAEDTCLSPYPPPVPA